jgi:hypothetical protein
MAQEVQVRIGSFGYASGTSAATVNVPAGARVRKVFLVADTGGATITIAGGSSIAVPAGVVFDQPVGGDAAKGADVVIGGALKTYYVAWETGV